MGGVLKSQSEYQKRIIVTGLKAIHYLASVAIFFVFWMKFRYGTVFYHESDTGFRYNYFTTLAYALLLFFFNRTYNAYLIGYSRIRDCVFAEFLSQFFAIGLLYFSVSLAWNQWHSPLIFIWLLVS